MLTLYTFFTFVKKYKYLHLICLQLYTYYKLFMLGIKSIVAPVEDLWSSLVIC